MNATANGFGLLIPLPSCDGSQLGTIIYIDELGTASVVGNIFDDGHFKALANQQGATLDKSTIEETHKGLTAAFTTGSLDVQPLPADEEEMWVAFSRRSLHC